VCTTQLITLKVLRNHFTAHSWLNVAYAIGEVSSIVDMVLDPRAHFKAMPLRVATLVSLWVGRWVAFKVFTQGLIMFFCKMSAYVAVIAGVGQAIHTVKKIHARIESKMFPKFQNFT
jgi:hypothetical protein